MAIKANRQINNLIKSIRNECYFLLLLGTDFALIIDTASILTQRDYL